MRIYDGSEYRDMTAEEEREIIEMIEYEKTRQYTEEEAVKIVMSSSLPGIDSIPNKTALRMVYFYPSWKPGTAYTVDQRIRHGENLYRCEQSHTSQSGWEPDITPALWTRISVEEWPEWVQPTGAQDAYRIGDKVSHNGKHWINGTDYNAYEPGVYGWEEQT